MSKKKIEVKESKPQTTVRISYRIFEITDEGHFREPTEAYDDNHIFDHYNGYPSLESAGEAVLEHKRYLDKENSYANHLKYVALPFIETATQVS